MPYSVGSAIVILGHDFPNQWYAGFNSFREELVTVLTLWLLRMLCSPTKLGVSLKPLVVKELPKLASYPCHGFKVWQLFQVETQIV